MTERGTMPPNMNGLAKFAFVGILLAMLVALPPSPAAQAHDPNDIWGWRGCHFVATKLTIKRSLSETTVPFLDLSRTLQV